MKSTTSTWCLRVAAYGLLAWSVGLPAWADYSSTVLSKNPKGYWRFNETNPVPQMTVATNYGSASSADGIYYNGATLISTPIAGSPGESAVKFDGLSQRIQIPFNANLNPASAFSVEAWVRPSTTTNVDNFWFRSVVRSGGRIWNGGYMLQYNSLAGADAGVFKFTLFNSSGGFEIYNTNFIAGTGFNIFATNDVWFHMVGTWSSSDNKGHLYVNGIEMTNMNTGTVGGVAYTPTTNGFIRIGAGDTDPSSTIPPSLNPGGTAQVAVYNTQLSPAQILAHYQAGTNTAANYSATILADAPVGYWKLNETTFAPLPVVVNQGLAGAALNGIYCFDTAPGVTGSVPPNYTGFDVTNKAAYLTNGASSFEAGGMVLFPPLRSVTDNTNLTIVALIKNNGPQAAAAAILGRRVPGAEKSAFEFDSAGSALGYNWDDSGSQFNYSSGFKPPDGVWTLAALVITPTNAVVYMDDGSGLRASTNNVANLTPSGFVHACYVGALGGNFANSARRYSGSVDELAVWTNSLSRQDMLDLREAWIGSGLFLAGQPAATRPVMLGGKAKFTVSVGGSTNYMPFTYQLKKDNVPVGPVSTSSTLFYTNVQPSDLAGSFTISIITNGAPSLLTSSSSSLVRWTLPGTYSGAVESYRPTAYYRFSETSPGTIYDIASTLDGITNALVSPTAGPNATDGADYGIEAGNTAFNFNGNGGGGGGFATLSGSGITFPDITATKVTIAGWIYPTASQIAFSGIYYTRATDYASLEFGPSGGYELGVAWASGNGNYNTHSLVFVNPNVWNFFAMVVTNDSATFYSYSVANGWQSNTVAGVFSPNRNMTGGTGTCIGTDPNTGLNRGVKGSIDEVAVFSRIMSWDDIQKLAYAGTTVNLAIERSGANNSQVGWSYGTLEWADTLLGPWTPVPGATAPSFTTNSASAQKFFRASY